MMAGLLRWLLVLLFTEAVCGSLLSHRVLQWPRRSRVVVASASTTPASGDASSASDIGPKLFLVDDQVGLRSAVSQYLSQRGFRCEAFSSAEEVLEALARAKPPPDALVADVLMPGGMDGLDLLRTVRADSRLCAMPVVLLTARGLTADRVAGYDAGASAYVSKPFEPEELVAVLRSITRNSLLARTRTLAHREHGHAHARAPRA